MSIRPASVALTMAVGLAVFLEGGIARGAGSIPPVDAFVQCSPELLLALRDALGVDGRAMRWLPVERIEPSQILQPPRTSGLPRRVWVDCSDADRVRIFFANWETQRFLVREVSLPKGWDELARESLAQVIGSSLAALATDEKAGLSLTEITTVLRRAPATAKESRRGWRFALGAFYAVQAFAPEQPVEQGFGVAAVVGARTGPWRPGAWLSAQLQWPETIATGLIGVRLDTVALRAGARLARSVAERVAVSLQLGGGVDAVHIAAREGSVTHSVLSPDRVSWQYDAEIGVAIAIRIGAWTELSATVLADADLGARHYGVVVDGVAVRALSPFWLRPGLLLGVAWP